MIELIKFHWKLIRRPSACLEEDIPSLPLWICVATYAFYSMLSLFLNQNSFTMVSDFYYSKFPNNPVLTLLGFTVAYQIVGVLIAYYIQPFIAKLFYRGIPEEPFNVNLFRKLIFGAGLSYVIYGLSILMPLKLIGMLFLLSGTMTVANGIVVGIVALASLWVILPGISYLIVYFKGLKRYFYFGTGTSIAVIVITSIISFGMMQLLTGGRLLDFFLNYLKA